MRRSDLALLHPDFHARLKQLLGLLAVHVPDLAVFESVRSPGRQAELYQKGRVPGADDFGRTVTRAGAYQSAHQYGMAVDLVFHRGGVWTWDEPQPGAWGAMKDLAESCGLETLSFERPHVQIAGFDWRGLQRGPVDEAGWERWLAERAQAFSDEPTANLSVPK